MARNPRHCSISANTSRVMHHFMHHVDIPDRWQNMQSGADCPFPACFGRSGGKLFIAPSCIFSSWNLAGMPEYPKQEKMRSQSILVPQKSPAQQSLLCRASECARGTVPATS
jgi:hypothetical protein